MIAQCHLKATGHEFGQDTNRNPAAAKPVSPAPQLENRLIACRTVRPIPHVFYNFIYQRELAEDSLSAQNKTRLLRCQPYPPPKARHDEFSSVRFDTGTTSRHRSDRPDPNIQYPVSWARSPVDVYRPKGGANSTYTTRHPGLATSRRNRLAHTMCGAQQVVRADGWYRRNRHTPSLGDVHPFGHRSAIPPSTGGCDDW